LKDGSVILPALSAGKASVSEGVDLGFAPSIPIASKILLMSLD